jgi:hypothetical protein
LSKTSNHESKDLRQSPTQHTLGRGRGEAPVWHYSGNPVIPRDIIGTANSVFNGAGYTDDFETFYRMENMLMPYNRNGVLFPEKIDGRFALLHRPSDSGHTPFGNIFYSESQGFCSMAGIGEDRDLPRLALDAVKEHLDSEHGIVLLWPAYSGYNLNLGEISSYPRGYKENGGVFCHNNPWRVIAEALLGRGERAFEYYRKICPAYLEENSRLHKTEPHVYAQMIAGKEAARPGEAKNSLLIGTAAWNFAAVSQWILGIRPEYEGLRIDPCIPLPGTALRCGVPSEATPTGSR